MPAIDARIERERQKVTEQHIFQLFSSLPPEKRSEIVRDLVGFCRVSEVSAKN